jgi:hypothetical protein
MKLSGLPLKNKIQHRFKELCDKGGGPGGGPTRGKVQQLLKEAGESLNAFGFSETEEHLKTFSDRNPWHVCFAVSLAWGHLAQLKLEMTDAVVTFLETGEGIWLDEAAKFCMERGPDAMRKPLVGAREVFSNLKLPDVLPNTLVGVKNAENRWLGRVLGPPRVPYIGSWNSTAMFMVALFAQPSLARSMKDVIVVLPPGGPIFTALSVLHKVKLLSAPPDGNDMDDGGWEPGVLFNNNALMQSLIAGPHDLNMIDLHSGLYMLGTKYPHADQWLK